jgi:hypothetical protein
LGKTRFILGERTLAHILGKKLKVLKNKKLKYGRYKIIKRYIVKV